MRHYERARRRTGIPAALLMILVMAAGACATTGATLGSGVGETLHKEPPYYAGRFAAGQQGSIAHLPIRYQRGGSQDASFDPRGDPGSPIASLLEEMNRHLEMMAVSVRLDVPGAERQPAPDVYFGCEQNGFGDCESESEEISVRGSPWMRLAVARPSQRWVSALREPLREANADLVLVITLEVGQYWTVQKNLRGDKEVRLGTDHVVGVPWLSSLSQPGQVLQLTGVVVDREGRAIRVGAEGLFARRTSLLASGFGFTALIGDEEIARIRRATRDDIPGRPLAWQVALENLVAGLLGT
jgi:hypothetical protein